MVANGNALIPRIREKANVAPGSETTVAIIGSMIAVPVSCPATAF